MSRAAWSGIRDKPVGTGQHEQIAGTEQLLALDRTGQPLLVGRDKSAGTGQQDESVGTGQPEKISRQDNSAWTG